MTNDQEKATRAALRAAELLRHRIHFHTGRTTTLHTDPLWHLLNTTTDPQTREDELLELLEAMTSLAASSFVTIEELTNAHADQIIDALVLQTITKTH